MNGLNNFRLCQFEIMVPDNQRILIRIIAFDLPAGLGKVDIIDDRASYLEIIELSGTPRLRTILSQSNAMWMRLIMDKYVGQRNIIYFRFELSSFEGGVEGTYFVLSTFFFL